MPSQNPTNPATLATLVKTMQTDYQRANSHKDLLAIVQQAIDYGKPLKYNNKLFYIVSAISLLILLSQFTDVAATWRTSIFGQNGIQFICFVIPALLFAGPLFLALSRTRKINALARSIFIHDACLDNNLKHITPPTIATVQQQFNEFIRGNYSQTFEYFATGKYESPECGFECECTFPYSLYHFHYVDKKTTTNSKGRSRTTYHHYHRYGVIVNNFTTANLQIVQTGLSNRHQVRWKTDSQKFNKNFKVFAPDEFTAAKFLKPTVIVAFEDFMEAFPKINVEINNQKSLCLSFQNLDILHAESTYGFDNPQEFYEALQGHTSLPRLQETLGFIHQLLKYTDNNFQK